MNKLFISTQELNPEYKPKSVSVSKFITPSVNLKPALLGDKPDWEKLENTAEPVRRDTRNHRYKKYKELEKDFNSLVIDTTSIHFISKELINKLAILECNQTDPTKTDSVNDPRLGTTNPKKFCGYCNQDYDICPGHLGKITLAKEFIHPLAIMPTIYILQSVCNSCGSLLIRPEEYESDFMSYCKEVNPLKQEISGLRDLSLLKKIAEITVKCRVKCTSIHSKVHPCKPNLDYDTKPAKGSYKIIQKVKKNGDTFHDIEMPVDKIRDIFKTLSKNEQQLKFLGFSEYIKPTDFILSVLPVIPEINRPSKTRDGLIDNDHLTTYYSIIISANNKLKELYANKKNIPVERCGSNNIVELIECAERNLYYYIYHFIDNSDKNAKIGSSDPLKSVLERLVKDGKESHFRKNAMGKRVNYGVRTVIGPGSIPFGYITCPQDSKILTVPETVNSRNIERIKQQYKDGMIPTIIPGVGPSSGLRISVAIESAAGISRIINIGDIVYINGQNGDLNIFNRQPTLHKHSIMGYKVIYDNDLNMKLHSSYTTPHNADFDGDEGNAHKIQTNEAIAETNFIANVTNNIVGNQFSRPIMGLVFNAPLSAYLLSKENPTFEDRYWDEAIEATTLSTDKTRLGDDFEARLQKHNINRRSGKALISILFPSNFYYNKGNVKIRDGIFIDGILNISHIGPKASGIIHVLYKNYNKDEVVRFFTEGQYLFDWFIEYRGFSIGISDCIPTDKVKIDKIVDAEVNKATILIQGSYKENMTEFDKKIQTEKIEGYLSNITGSLSNSYNENNLSNIAITPDNPLNIMSNSGAKGDKANITQIIGCLGEQFLKGKLPEFDMTNKTRCLPFFEENSTNIEARGFVRSSFVKGLRPSEMIFHMASARVGLIDTAIQTADTGYMHHKISKVLEDITIDYNGAVVNSNGVIFQYSAGFNSANLVKIESKIASDYLSPIDFKTTINKLNYEAGYDNTN